MTKHCTKCCKRLDVQEMQLGTLAGRCFECYFAHDERNDPNEADLPRPGQRGDGYGSKDSPNRSRD